MAKNRITFDPNRPEVVEELRRREPPVADAPATVPSGAERDDPQPGGRPPEDGGVAQHPIHDSDVEDLGPEDFEELTDEVEETGIKAEP